MTARILVCARSSRERDHLVASAIHDGALLDRRDGRWRAILPKLDIERFEIFDHPGRHEQVRGITLAGVLNLEAVADPVCRDYILSRIRP